MILAVALPRLPVAITFPSVGSSPRVVHKLPTSPSNSILSSSRSYWLLTQTTCGHTFASSTATSCRHPQSSHMQPSHWRGSHSSERFESWPVQYFQHNMTQIAYPKYELRPTKTN
ncbi:hypothetical protein EDC04DRAFT_2699124 [Pisolithus marmoratus]|nr:hypothetical protein EDC04DRAFT_2699124 [Pisolithus marmoratus]